MWGADAKIKCEDREIKAMRVLAKLHSKCQLFKMCCILVWIILLHYWIDYSLWLFFQNNVKTLRFWLLQRGFSLQLQTEYLSFGLYCLDCCIFWHLMYRMIYLLIENIFSRLVSNENIVNCGSMSSFLNVQSAHKMQYYWHCLWNQTLWHELSHWPTHPQNQSIETLYTSVKHN